MFQVLGFLQCRGMDCNQRWANPFTILPHTYQQSVKIHDCNDIHLFDEGDNDSNDFKWYIMMIILISLIMKIHPYSLYGEVESFGRVDNLWGFF